MHALRHTAFTELPIVDIASLFSSDIKGRTLAANKLDKAAREAGFLYIKGHQVDVHLIKRLKAVAKEYFTQDIKAKMNDYIGLSTNHSGYVPQGEETFYGEAIQNNQADLKESYDIGPETPSLMTRFVKDAGTRWPANNRHFKKIISDYYTAMVKLSHTLFKGFALALSLPENTFTQHLNQPPSQLRLLHYFDKPDATENDSGIGAHTDYEFFTILLPTSPGLQVLNGAKQWIPVPVVDDCFVVNIGDMMELMTNGHYQATPHRVIQVKKERYAFPFFASLDYDKVVEPIASFIVDGEEANYKPVVCGDHLLAQTVNTFSYLQKRMLSGEIKLPDTI